MVTLSGTSPYEPAITLYNAVPNAAACSANREEYTADPKASGYVFEAPNFRKELELSIPTPGAYLLCGYLGLEGATASASMTVGPSAAEEAATKAATEAAEAQAKEAAEAKAREVAEQARVTFLRVKAVSDPGASSSNPGHTKIAVTTNPYAHVTITINQHGGTFRYRAPGNGGADIAWSCRHPGLTYHYVVTVAGGSGAVISRSGRFRVPLTASMCRADARRSAEHHQQEAREEEERKKREKREEESPKYEIEQAEKEYCERVLLGRPGFPSTVAGHIYLSCETRTAGRIIVSESTISG
jgi:hypothetical protein